MGWDLFAYRICFISGVVYAAIAALIGGLLGFGRMVVSRQAGGSSEQPRQEPAKPEAPSEEEEKGESK